MNFQKRFKGKINYVSKKGLVDLITSLDHPILKECNDCILVRDDSVAYTPSIDNCSPTSACSHYPLRFPIHLANSSFDNTSPNTNLNPQTKKCVSLKHKTLFPSEKSSNKKHCMLLQLLQKKINPNAIHKKSQFQSPSEETLSLPQIKA